eukprot:6199122-Pleurochrysis_carterae.AAC.1
MVPKATGNAMFSALQRGEQWSGTQRFKVLNAAHISAGKHQCAIVAAINSRFARLSAVQHRGAAL